MTDLPGPTATRAGIYCRISQDREGAGLGVQRQEKECRELAERLGWEVVQVYDDNDESAFQRRRPRLGWVRMMEDLKDGRIDAVLAWHVDRLYRRPRDLDDLIDIIELRHTPVQTVAAGTLDLSNPAGIAMAKTAAVFAEYESAQKARRQRSKARELAEAGKVSGGGTRPFGFEIDFRTVRTDEAELIREAAHAILRTGMAIRSLCADWNARGIPTATGKRWTPHVLRRMLMSARVSGRREHQKVGNIGAITGPAVWAAIISAEDSDRLRELLSDPARLSSAGTARRYLLTGGLAICGRCGTALVARPQSNHRRSYVCAAPTGGIQLSDDQGRPLVKPDGSPVMCAQGNLRVDGDRFELFVIEAVFDYLDEFVHLAAAVRTGSEGDQEAEIWATLVDYQSRLNELESAFWVHRRLPERTYQRLRSELESQIETTQAALARVRHGQVMASMPTSSAQARTLWPEKGLQWRRSLVQTLVERVIVGPAVRGRNKFDPDRVKIQFRRPADSVREDRFGPGGIQFVLIEDGSQS